MPTKYDIVYADPPWAYRDKQFAKKTISGCAEDHYPTMSTKDICELPVKDITNKDCLLFMWAVSPNLDQAMKVIDAWGFEYKTIAFVWYKEKHNPGYYTMGECEICLVAKKKGGKIPTPRGARNIRQFLSEKRSKHSKKPAEIRKRIELMFPTQTKVEMFAREAPEGWDIFGNEVENSPGVAPLLPE